jgi:hypothetical protein
MTIEDYIEDALAQVNTWELPEKDFTQAVNDQARLMAGMDLESFSDPDFTSPYTPLQF